MQVPEVGEVGAGWCRRGTEKGGGKWAGSGEGSFAGGMAEGERVERTWAVRG